MNGGSISDQLGTLKEDGAEPESVRRVDAGSWLQLPSKGRLFLGRDVLGLNFTSIQTREGGAGLHLRRIGNAESIEYVLLPLNSVLALDALGPPELAGIAVASSGGFLKIALASQNDQCTQTEATAQLRRVGVMWRVADDRDFTELGQCPATGQSGSPAQHERSPGALRVDSGSVSDQDGTYAEPESEPRMGAEPSVGMAREGQKEAGEFPLPSSLRQDFEPLAILGSGSFGCVYRARSLATGQTCALKVFKKSRDTRLQLAEVEFLQQLEHRGIVRSHGYREYGDLSCLAMQEAPGLSLRECIADTERTPQE
ncbi:MAG: hypothetical protein HQ582_16755, partial [Planctomycetes bacterium]|nr:hypothetical protein [Planctomycetota bacterium]